MVVCHPWWGLNEDVAAYCDRLATSGLVAVAPDLYAGPVATTIEEADRLSESFDETAADAIALAAIDRLAERLGPEGRLATVGFSMGVAWSMWSPAQRAGFVASVVYYGTIEGPSLSRASVPVLAHCAETDPYESAEAVAKFEATLKSAGRNVTTRYWSLVRGAVPAGISTGRHRRRIQAHGRFHSAAGGRREPRLVGSTCSEQVKQSQRGLPAADGHRLVLTRRQHFAEPASRAFRAEASGVDHAIAGPDPVDTLSWLEDGHGFGRIDAHEEDPVAVVDARLLAETLGLLAHDRFELVARQDENLDELGIELECAR